mgnify:FL=1
MSQNIIILGDERRQIFDYSGGTNIIYIGKAHPAALTSEAKWQIQKLTYDADSKVINIDFADGTPAYTKIWDNRVNFDYTPD